VILPAAGKIANQLQEVRDSKQLSADERERARIKVEDFSLSWAVGYADNREIDRLGIVPATRLAIWRALDQLGLVPDHVLVDYLVLPDLPIPQTRLVKGDARSLSIAAASILAKTHRDGLMTTSASKFPNYGFETNMGYGTAYHREAIQSYGPCSLHRMTFAPMRKMDREQSGD
jgi:ribonuclease HII